MMYDAAGGIDPIGTYVNGVATHVDVISDFDTQTYSVYLDGTLASANNPFMYPADSGNQIDELFFQQPSSSGGLNEVALSNVSYSVGVPEPGALRCWRPA